MFRSLILCLSLHGFAATMTQAQIAPSDATDRLVADVTAAFFGQLPKEDFASERAFMTDGFAAMASIPSWTANRKRLIKLTGRTPAYRAHAMTYYQKASLLAAVDFWGQAAKPETYVCGFLLWEIPEPNLVGLSRIEQNVVDVAVMRSMPIEQAAQLMTSFRCPKALIEQVLGVAVKKTN